MVPSAIRTETLTQTGFKRKKETHDLTHQETGSTEWMGGVGAVNQWLISVIGHRGSPSQGWFSLLQDGQAAGLGCVLHARPRERAPSSLGLGAFSQL